MIRNLCVSIPKELESYRKTKEIPPLISIKLPQKNFGIEIVKKKSGEIDYAAHYSDTGELVSKSYYCGSAIYRIEMYARGKLSAAEEYNSDKLIKKISYDANSNIKSETTFRYKRNQVCFIQKRFAGNCYSIEYGYDDLDRTNSRVVYINNTIVDKQKYRLDILDRISEYSDYNQNVKVHKISRQNQLIYYTITDKMNNEIIVYNNFEHDVYKYTEICLNGHKKVLTDWSYVDNIMLKKPYANEDDLDLIISNLLCSRQNCSTKRSSGMDISGAVIQENIQSRALPISIRKRLLYNMSVNAS